MRVTPDDLDDLEESIELLKVAYERYFNGVDRIPPAREHDAVKRMIRELTKRTKSTTALRFRMNTLRSRLVTYEHYWTRILGQIERGTFKRVLAESARREREFLAKRAAEAEAEAKKSGQPARAARASGGSRHQLPDGVDAKQARELYKQFVAAKKAAGESTSGLTYGKLVDRLAREVPRLREQHGDNFRFEVASVGGKVRLRARRKKVG
ncbi:hypothetical protein G6O69_32340 [Pseudenhygromyxa sp. WMMC2535]|uniref:MXAN_5187 C-terminal domain-containing protein n=1 Tax=Pseudenhygromyxa sp. WMMC2535 TaxID=2712867 RepID=UPI001555CC9E|nr:MXAN_5187 C-terminal domain-containing protein [Pseudenhygromyxa sp. WMMC2535]NVB42558.1 hypothetical protein [Pseudenhygromyxa sp. WMMC2535]